MCEGIKATFGTRPLSAEDGPLNCRRPAQTRNT